MSEEAIERVDELVRKNNAKYKDQQSQKAYEQALKEYQRQAKAELTRQYAQAVKEGNRKAVEKAKMAKKAQQKPKKKQPIPQPVEQQKKIEPPKKRMSQAEVNVVNRTIQARAQRIMQEQQLQRLSRKLQEEKKRTKLYELGEKCKKMLSKSHQRIVTAKNIPEERMKILKKLEDKAVGEINELDCIINNLIDKANGKPTTGMNKQPHLNKFNIEKHINQQNLQQWEEKEMNEEEGRESSLSNVDDDEEIEGHFDWQGDEFTQQAFNNLENNFLSINTLIFQKTSEELLQMDYIPI